MCNVDDLDIPDVWREKIIKSARKRHRCYECTRTIEVKESYHYAFGVWDGNAEEIRTCIHCRMPAKWLITECGTYHLGYLYSEILEHAQEYKSLRLYRWAINMSKQWRYTITIKAAQRERYRKYCEKAGKPFVWL